jgi:type IV secretory pathway VirJ component
MSRIINQTLRHRRAKNTRREASQHDSTAARTKSVATGGLATLGNPTSIPNPHAQGVRIGIRATSDASNSDGCLGWADFDCQMGVWVEKTEIFIGVDALRVGWSEIGAG